jgi:hypothetical protein
MTEALYTVRFDVEVKASSPEQAATTARDILLNTDIRVIADVFPFVYIEEAEEWHHTEVRGWWVEFDGAVRPSNTVEWERMKRD